MHQTKERCRGKSPLVDVLLQLHLQHHHEEGHATRTDLRYDREVRLKFMCAIMALLPVASSFTVI